MMAKNAELKWGDPGDVQQTSLGQSPVSSTFTRYRYKYYVSIVGMAMTSWVTVYCGCVMGRAERNGQLMINVNMCVSWIPDPCL